MCSRAAIFGAPVTEPGGNVAREASAHPHAGAEPARRPSTRGGRARGGARPRAAAGTSTEPNSHTRPRSLRTRSTIITFSARSLAVRPAGVGRRALDRARSSTTSPSRRRNRSGDAEATRHPCDGQPHDGAVRRRVALGERGARARPRRHPPGIGADSRRVRFTWYTSPAAIDGADRPHPVLERRLRRASVVHASAAGPRHGGPGHGRAGRTWREAGADRRALEREHDRPEPGRLERREVVGEVDEARWPAAHRPRPAARRRRRGRGMARSVRSRLGTRRHPVPHRKVARPCTSSSPRSTRRCARSCATSPRREIAPHAEAWDRDHHFPVDVVRGMGDLGLFGIPFPEEYGGGRRRPHDAVHRHRGARPGRPLDGHHARGRCGPRRQPDPPLRHRGAEADLAARPVRRARPRRLRAHRAGGGQRRRRHPHHGRARRRRGSGCSTARRRSSPTPARRSPRSSRSPPAPARARSARSSCPSGTPGFEVQPPYRKMGWHASDTHGLTFTDCRVPEDNLLGERGRGFAQFLQILDEGRVAISALAVGCIQACLEHCVALRPGPHTRSGKPIGANQGVAFQVRRPGGDGGDGAPAHLPGGVAPRHRPALQAGGRHGQAPHHRGRRGRHPHRHPDLRRLRVHGRDARWPASTGTPRSSRSARAPARSSGSSSAGSSGLPVQ